MDQTKLLKADILDILSKSISGGVLSDKKKEIDIEIVPEIAYESSKMPQTFFGGADDPECKKPDQVVKKFCAKPKKTKEKKQAKEPKVAKPKSTRPVSAWILHVKKYSADNKVSYKQALKDAKASYKKDDKVEKVEKVDKPKEKIKLVSFEEKDEKPKKKKKLRLISKVEKKEKPKANDFANCTNAKNDAKKLIDFVDKFDSKVTKSAFKSKKVMMEAVENVKKYVDFDGCTEKERVIMKKALDGVAKPTKKKLQVVSKVGGSVKKSNPWISFVKDYAKKHNLKYNVAIKEAKPSYKKMAVGGAEPPDTHKMPDGTVMSGATHTDVSKPVVKDEPLPPQVVKQNNIVLSDVLENFDIFGKEFMNIANSSKSINQKQTAFDGVMERAGQYKTSIDISQMDAISNKRINGAFEYLQETYNIGYRSLTGGQPINKLNFEDYVEDADMGSTIYTALKVPPMALDTYRKDIKKYVHNEDDTTIQDDLMYFRGREEREVLPIMTGYPSYIIKQEEMDAPVYGQPAMYSISQPVPFYESNTLSGGGSCGGSYPYVALEEQHAIQTPLYRKNMLDPKSESSPVYGNSKSPMMGGAVSKKMKKKLTEEVKKLFIRDMKKKYPNQTVKKIKDVYKKNKKKIENHMTEIIADNFMMAGACGSNQYQSGSECYDKQERQSGPFDRDKFFEEQKVESDRNLADAPLVAPKPFAVGREVRDNTDKSNENFVVIPQSDDADSGDGPIYGTDGTDLSDPKAWLDTVANIALGTAKGVKTVWDVLNPFSWFS